MDTIRKAQIECNKILNKNGIIKQFNTFQEPVTPYELAKKIKLKAESDNSAQFRARAFLNDLSAQGMVTKSPDGKKFYKTGDRNKIHNHPSAEYSFNYYVQIPENSAPTRFVASDKSIPAKEGRLTLFAGHLKHEVPPSNHQGFRITLAGNLRREKV